MRNGSVGGRHDDGDDDDGDDDDGDDDDDDDDDIIDTFCFGGEWQHRQAVT